MSDAMLPRRVLVSLGIAAVFVGAVVLAGALFRHHDASPHRPPVSTVTSR